jgi:hypothetical protein
MPQRNCAQLSSQVDILASVMLHICEALPASEALQVASAVRATVGATDAHCPDDVDASRVQVLAPLLVALRR